MAMADATDTPMINDKPRRKVSRAANPSQEKVERGDAGVRTVRVTVQLLDALAQFQEPARITDLALRLNMTLPRVSRHVATLRSLGLIDKAEPLEAYRLGHKLLSLGQAALAQNSLASTAYPHLRRLRDTSKRTVLLSTQVAQGASVLVCLDSGASTTIFVRPGTILEFPTSPSARVLYAFSTDDHRRAIGAAHDLLEYAQISRRQLESRLEQIQRDYYDFSADARRDGIGAIACPIFDHENKASGAVSVVAPTASLPKTPDEHLTGMVKSCAADISDALGSTAWKAVRR